MAARQTRDQRQEPDEAEAKPDAKPPAAKPVWSRRYWTGGGAVEVAVFERTVDNGNNSFTAYSTGVRRTYKDGDEYKSIHSFRPEDLLALHNGGVLHNGSRACTTWGRAAQHKL